MAALVIDVVLSLHLKEFALLVHDQDGLGEQWLAAHGRALGDPEFAELPLDLFARRAGATSAGPIGGEVGNRRINPRTSTRANMLSPLPAIPVPQLVSAEGVGVPPGGAGSFMCGG